MALVKQRLGIVLFQLGGPDNLKAVQPFLYNLFCDSDIIKMPLAQITQRPLAKLISFARAQRMEARYEQIGGSSPLRRHTEQQASALQAKLRSDGLDACCFVGMRYWHPFISEAITHLRAAQCKEVVLLPLYPQYSCTTTGSSLNEWRRRFNDSLPVHCIKSFYRNSAFLEALVERINEALARFPVPHRPEIIFSAHGVPISVIKGGDPYQKEVEETVALVAERGAWSNSCQLCYQSRVGIRRWLEPSLHHTLHRIAARGQTEVCIVPISFVSDHVETLSEIDKEAREQALQLGFKQFEMTTGLNASPKFIGALAQLVRKALAEPTYS